MGNRIFCRSDGWYSKISAGVLVSVLLLASCSHDDDENEFMAPGQNCLSCHGSGGNAAHEATFTIAGTVFAALDSDTSAGVEGVSILIVDAADKQLTLKSNRVGNFFTSESVQFPLKSVKVAKEGKEHFMDTQVSTGACSSCHSQPASGGAPGRLYLTQ